MPIVVRCSCGQSSEAPDSALGLNLPCPGCGRAVAVPVPQVGPVVLCRCGLRFRADPRLIGSVVPCPSCHHSIAVPHPAAQTIFDELPPGPIPVRRPPPPALASPAAGSARYQELPRTRPRRTLRISTVLRFGCGTFLLTWAALQTVWLFYNLFIDMIMPRPWLIPLGIPFLLALWSIGIRLVLPQPPRKEG